MITVICRFCPKEFEATRIRDVMDSRRIHEELRHREAKVETDTSTQY